MGATDLTRPDAIGKALACAVGGRIGAVELTELLLRSEDDQLIQAHLLLALQRLFSDGYEEGNAVVPDILPHPARIGEQVGVAEDLAEREIGLGDGHVAPQILG